MFLKLFYTFLVTFPTLIILDLIWFKLLSRGFYQNSLEQVINLKPANLTSAAILYIIMAIGIIVFVVMPSLDAKSLLKAISLGALLGLVTYTIYDLTNYATIRNWPLSVVIVDIIWGVVIMSVASLVTYLVASKWF